jgi:hypothetical protein
MSERRLTDEVCPIVHEGCISPKLHRNEADFGSAEWTCPKCGSVYKITDEKVSDGDLVMTEYGVWRYAEAPDFGKFTNASACKKMVPA